ncbi:hypothetical protein BASA84_000040 [Batrachochytrium salamandrivorans]|nr:hypothetical protein BASA84_000040 [Batrachochytrium salamandrivorans]
MLLSSAKSLVGGLVCMLFSFSGSKATFRGRTATARWSSIDHFVCNQAARALLTSPRVNRQPYSSTSQHRRLYRATTKKAICRAKNAYRAWLASRDSILSPQEPYKVSTTNTLAEATASRLTKQDRLRWRSHCTRIDNLLAGGCAKQAWNAAKRMACASGHSCRSSNPIRNEEGVLQFQPLFPYHAPEKGTRDDGITTALMQAIAHDPKDHGTGDVNLDRPGALALLRVANTIFLSGVIPKVWTKWWRCPIISIPKKGDATLASNLRGISLI